ncbi:hypothetical protein [Caulobacter sp. DWR3-1-2]|uniref:beta strand repeat-containing protein n=1 Tax=Caulobacter sp. DWR3-1-2 TaxID=2804647 RepID=UPI003CEE262C
MSKALRKWAKFVVPILSKKVLAASVLTAAAVLTGNPALIQAAFSADAALVANSLTPKQKITSTGQETSWKADARAGIPYAVGRCAIAGNQVFQRSAGGSNKFKNFVTVYTGAGPIDAIESYLVNDVATSFTADSGEGATGYYQNRMWLKTQLGATTAPYLHWSATGSKDTPANHGGMPSEWGASQELPGFAASLWALEWDTAKYSAGVPGPKMVARWVKVYDPRKDSTYPGGSGSHRYADPSSKAAHLAAQATWEWSANPYLHGLMWCLGRWTGDPARSDLPLVKSHGLGAPLSMVEVANFVDAANIAQANGWTLGGQVSSTDDKWEVLKAFLEAGGGEPILLGHKIGCMINAPKISLATIRKADVIGDVSVAATTAIEDRINTIWPSYTEETLNWSVVPFDEPVQVGAYLAPDKGSRSIEMPLPLVQSPVQVAQLARYRIEDSRELTPIVIPAKPWTMWLRPGDCFTADEPEWGLNARKLLILQRKRDPATMTVTFICRTETDGKHAFALGQTATAPDTPALTGLDGNIVPPPASGAWAIVGGQTAGPDGALPGIVIQGEAELYDAVTVVVDYREVISAGVYGAWQSQSFPASSKTIVVTGVKPGARYQVRLRYITAKGVENPGGNTGLGEVTVGGVDAGTLSGRAYGEIVADASAGVSGAVASAQADATAALANIAAEITRATGTEGALTASLASLTSTVGTNKSSADASILVLTNADISLAASLTSLTSTVGANKALADSSIATLSSADTAIAARTNLLEATARFAPNILPNPTLAIAGASALLAEGWTLAGGFRRMDLTGAGEGFGADLYFPNTVVTTASGVSDFFPLDGATPVSLAGRRLLGGGAFGSGYIEAFIKCYDAAGLFKGNICFDIPWNNGLGSGTALGWQDFRTTLQTAPAGTAKARVQFDVSNVGGAGYKEVVYRTFKVSTNPSASYTDDATATGLGDRLVTATARIATEEVTRAADDTALSASLTTLTATVGTNTANISANLVTQASGDAALAASITSLTATVGTNTAAISAESATRATNDAALGVLITNLTATVGSNTAAISSNFTTLVGVDAALAASITSLTSTVSGNTGAISSEAATRATDDAALASSITSLTATVGGHTASITSQATVLSDLSGKLVAYAKFTAAAGSSEAYIEMVAASDLSLLNLRAKTIQLGGVSGPVITVEGGVARISNAVIGGAQIENLTVGPLKLAPGAVQVSRRYRACPGGDLSPTETTHNLASANTTMVALDQTFSGGELLIEVQLQGNSQSTTFIDAGIYYDGVLIKRFAKVFNTISKWTRVSYRHTPTAGSHIYRLDLIQVNATASVGERLLDITELNGGYAVNTSGGSG